MGMIKKMELVWTDKVQVTARLSYRDPSPDEVLASGLRLLSRRSPRAKWRCATTGDTVTIEDGIAAVSYRRDSLDGYLIDADHHYWLVEVTVLLDGRGLHEGSRRHIFKLTDPVTREAAEQIVANELLCYIRRVAADELLGVAERYLSAAREVLA